jgi:GGDEF domain-containing protein
LSRLAVLFIDVDKLKAIAVSYSAAIGAGT